MRVSEIEKQFMTEFDYRREADNLERIRRNIMPKWGDRVVS
jgi:aarF domain-containing kinase